MSRAMFFAWLYLFIDTLVATGQEQVRSAPPLEHIWPQSAIARFAVAKRGDVLLVPVAIREIEYAFLLDTGAMTNVLDQSLVEEIGPLSRSRRSYPKGVPQTYVFPDAKLSGTNIQVQGDTVSVNLADMRRVSGYDIRGVLGINFLQKFVIELDFDAGSVTLFEQTPALHRMPVAIERDPFNRPIVMIEVAPDDRVPFLIDTGMASPGIGEVAASTFEGLQKAARLRPLETDGKILTISGVVSNRRAQLDVFRFGDYEHHNLRLNAGTLNALGLRYLSRYKVTLDLPRHQAWFEPGKRYSNPSVFDASGLVVSRQSGKTTIDWLHPDGPAHEAGIKSGDVLTHINGQEVGAHSLFTIRQALCESGRKLGITVERSGASHDFVLALRNWQNAELNDSK